MYFGEQIYIQEDVEVDKVVVVVWVGIEPVGEDIIKENVELVIRRRQKRL